jgi:hypothetical protein
MMRSPGSPLPADPGFSQVCAFSSEDYSTASLREIAAWTSFIGPSRGVRRDLSWGLRISASDPKQVFLNSVDEKAALRLLECCGHTFALGAGEACQKSGTVLKIARSSTDDPGDPIRIKISVWTSKRR